MKTHWHILIVPALLAATALEIPAQTPRGSVPFTLVENGSAVYVNGGLDLVITDQVVWEAMWSLLHRGNDPQPPLPAVDFDNRMVIVVGMGQQPTAGGQITVERIAVTRRGVTQIYVKQSQPGRSCAPTQIVASPYAVYETERHPFTTFRHSVDSTLCP